MGLLRKIIGLIEIIAGIFSGLLTIVFIWGGLAGGILVNDEPSPATAIILILIFGTICFFLIKDGISSIVDRKLMLKQGSCASYFSFLKNTPPAQLSPAEFEECVARWIEKNWNVRTELVGKTGDFGADVIAYNNEHSMAVQCKRYQGGTGVRAVQEVNAARDYYQCASAAVFTTGHFTKQAVMLAQRTGVQLFRWNGYTFKELNIF